MRQVVTVVGSCIILLLALRLVVIGHDSAESFGLVRLAIPTPSPAEECDSFARFWMDISGTGPDDVAAVSHCRRGPSGEWGLAQDALRPDAGDPALARAIEDQLAGLEASLPLDLQNALARTYDPVTGARHGIGQETYDINRRYARALWGYLQDPEHGDFAAYVAWQVVRRDTAVAVFLQGCGRYPRMAATCTSMARSVGAGLAPWPWELDDDLLLAEYLAQGHGADVPASNEGE